MTTRTTTNDITDAANSHSNDARYQQEGANPSQQDDPLNRWIDRLQQPGAAAMVAGIVFLFGIGSSAFMLRRRRPPTSAAHLPAHFKELRVPPHRPASLSPTNTTTDGSIVNSTPTATAVAEELEPDTPEARRLGQQLAVKALLLGSALCLSVSAAGTWLVGRLLGVNNLQEFSALCRRDIPRLAGPVHRMIYRDVDEQEVMAIPLPDSLEEFGAYFTEPDIPTTTTTSTNNTSV